MFPLLEGMLPRTLAQGDVDGLTSRLVGARGVDEVIVSVCSMQFEIAETWAVDVYQYKHLG